MKNKHLIIMAALSGVAALYWQALAAPALSDSKTDSKEALSVAAVEKTAALRRMEVEEKRVRERLHISAPMEIELVNGFDPIMEAYESGFIIEATLEQVEAALAAAALTKETQDDLDALELKHRGSYRFFTPDSGGATNDRSKNDQF